jgi:N4-gp56 family major capsid protein
MAGETGTTESGLDTAAFNLAVYYALRPQLMFDRQATVKATRQSHRGASVTFTQMNDLAVVTTPLNEYTDVTAVALTDTPLTVTLTEFGAATISTAKLRGTSFIEFDPTAANRLGYNAGRTVDHIARDALGLTTNEMVLTGVAPQPINSARVRAAFGILQNANVRPFPDGLYHAIISPYQAIDLRGETDAAGWRIPHQYAESMVGGIQRGELGIYEGFRFFVSNILAAGTEANTQRAFFLGEEALAKAFSSAPGFGSFPTVRPGPVTDKLMRFRPLGWYWLGNYKVFRNEAVIYADCKNLAPTT